MKKLSLILSFVCTVLLSACAEDSKPVIQDSPDNPYIVIVNNPLRYFAERLLGDKVEVRMLAPERGDPSQWQPTVEEALQLQQARLILLNGAGYSGWLDKVALSERWLVVTSKSVKDHWIALKGQTTHSHGPQGEHAHGVYAFTTWMDMSLATVQAEAVATALQQAWPEYSELVVARLQELKAELLELDEGFQEQAQRLADRQIIYSHPVYQYFERRYQLQGVSLHWEPNVMPSEQQWQELAEATGDSTLFVWEREPSPDILKRMDAMGLPSVVINPAAGQGDWLKIQRGNLKRLSH